MNQVEIAKQKFKEGYNWTQSVLFAFADDRLIDQDTALKITTGFGGGVALTGEICGACTAGVMLLGLTYGKGITEDESYKENTYQKVQDFLVSFKKKNDSIFCRDIIHGCDLKTEEGKKIFNENNYEDKICLNCIASSIEILYEFI